jgi:Family of unknown function (DUF5683)
MAAFLSALLPGLGQFYNRQWIKGLGFLLGMVLTDGVLGVSADTVRFFQDAVSGRSSVDPHSFLLRMLPVLAIALGSMTDAARTAKRSQHERPSS